MKRKSETIHNPRVSEKQQGAYILSIFLLISIVSNYDMDRGGKKKKAAKEKRNLWGLCVYRSLPV
jgi:hypothetical protein